MNFWKYAPAAALSEDGTVEVSSVDRDHYMARIRGDVFFINCEHFSNDRGGFVCFFMDEPIKVLSAAGERKPTREEIASLRGFLAAAVPLFGRGAEFA